MSHQRTIAAGTLAALAALQNHGADAQGAQAPQFPEFFTTSMKEQYMEIESESVSNFVEESVGEVYFSLNNYTFCLILAEDW
jgi:hypothetical protein